MTEWNTGHIPGQSGRVAVVTGANSGLGLATATELARHTPRVVLAVRDVTAGELYAATAPDVRGGQFFGPSGRRETRGHVVEVHPSTEAADPAAGRRLWTAAEALTGLTYL
jgi:NAD(P)-dependent dehydrogenase (short-subunit alcohol dehydrogenase family)